MYFFLQPKVVSATDDAELEKHMEDLDKANREVAGDSDEDSYDDDEEGSGSDENEKVED